MAVRVLHERIVSGEPRRAVVSHFNKATKGRLVRGLLESGANPRTPVRLAETLREENTPISKHVTEPTDRPVFGLPPSLVMRGHSSWS